MRITRRRLADLLRMPKSKRPPPVARTRGARGATWVYRRLAATALSRSITGATGPALRRRLESGFRPVGGRLASPGDLLDALPRLLVSVSVVSQIIPAPENVVNQIPSWNAGTSNVPMHVWRHAFGSRIRPDIESGLIQSKLASDLLNGLNHGRKKRSILTIPIAPCHTLPLSFLCKTARDFSRAVTLWY
jgi:hypothetical protein